MEIVALSGFMKEQAYVGGMRDKERPVQAKEEEGSDAEDEGEQVPRSKGCRLGLSPQLEGPQPSLPAGYVCTT